MLRVATIALTFLLRLRLLANDFPRYSSYFIIDGKKYNKIQLTKKKWTWTPRKKIICSPVKHDRKQKHLVKELLCSKEHYLLHNYNTNSYIIWFLQSKPLQKQWRYALQRLNLHPAPLLGTPNWGGTSAAPTPAHGNSKNKMKQQKTEEWQKRGEKMVINKLGTT